MNANYGWAINYSNKIFAFLSIIQILFARESLFAIGIFFETSLGEIKRAMVIPKEVCKILVHFWFSGQSSPYRKPVCSSKIGWSPIIAQQKFEKPCEIQVYRIRFKKCYSLKIRPSYNERRTPQNRVEFNFRTRFGRLTPLLHKTAALL